jgi:NTP pyrophosphatase (non-canonical NTP hydrolase)
MSSTSGWDLTSCMEQLRAFRDERDWAQFHNPKDLAAAIAIEAAELQELFLWKDMAGVDEVTDSPTLRPRIESELADVLIYSLYLADRLNIDLAQVTTDKLASNGERYDVEGHRGKAVKAARLSEVDPDGAGAQGNS